MSTKRITNIINYNSNPVLCFKCSTIIPYDKRRNRFCSRSCSASVNNVTRPAMSEESKNKISIKMRGRMAHNKGKCGILSKSAKFIEAVCPTCNIIFSKMRSQVRKYCSNKCVKVGGYREGSGRSYSGRYKGIYCGSTYELAWVIYNLDHHISFKRFPGCLRAGKLKYFPDFLMEDESIVEIKGYHTDAVDKKTQLAKDCGYDIRVLYKEDLKEAFQYVYDTYHTKDLKSLYE